MYYIEINNRINQLLNVFHQFGMRRIEEDSSIWRKTEKLKYLILEVSFAMSLVLGGLLSDDRNESVYSVTVGIAILVATVKQTYILWKKNEILSFIKDIGTHSVEDYDEFVKVNEKVKKLMNLSFSLFLIICASSIVLIIICLPVFSGQIRLPVHIWFPFDWKKNGIAYWIAYAFVSIGIIYGVVASSLNIIIWYLMMNSAIKYQILGNQFRNMFLPKPTILKRNISKDKEENLFLQEFIRLIKTHRNIQETIDLFKSCFGNLFFIQITTSGIGICGSVYILTFATQGVTVFQYIIYCAGLLYNFFDIFVIMFFGNEIKLSSDLLSYSLFESAWLERSKSCKKCIIILAELLKQPHELVIGILYPLNMETFISIVNFAYRTFNILKNFK